MTPEDKYAQSKAFDALNARGLAGKREYVRSLEQRSDAEALSLLVECLCDESSYLRALAEDALLRLGERGAPVLIPLLEQGLWFTRASAARVLGRAAHRPAVMGLLRQAEDANASVADSALEALVAIGRGGGAIAVARGLHALSSDTRRRRFEELRRRDRQLADRVDGLMEHDELMTLEEDLSDESPVVRAAEEGLEWEVLTGATTEKKPPPPSHTPRGEPPRA
jgi:HEAT repeat protein